MISEHKELITSDFKGTVIDIETIGSFENNPLYRNDTRRMKNIKQVIFGYISSKELRILYAKDKESIEELNCLTVQILETLERPFYALNTSFESGVWFNQLQKKCTFDGELQKERFERKADARRYLKIPNYDDPFNDDGYACMIAWEKGQFDKAVAHNRACLLKERDILIKRGCTNPFPCQFIK
jgi:hypothetical protein